MWRFALAALALGAGCTQDNTFSERTGSDTWAQAANNEIDILFVVDESGSMQEEQATLAAGISSFVSEMEATGTDFHLGVITTSFDYTDPTRGELIGEPAYLTNADDYQTLFPQRVQVGVGGSDKEKGLEAANYAVSAVMTVGGPNSGFIRPEAQLLVLYVTDEDDCSDRGALEGRPQEDCYYEASRLVPVSTFVAELNALKGDASLVTASAIVGTDSSTCQGVYPGGRYMDMAALTGGLVGDICSSDWSSIMGDLGLTASGVLASFQTTYAADPETLEVFVDDVKVESGPATWSYNLDTWFITFEPEAVPPRGSVIVANYTILPGQPEPAVSE